MSVSSSTFCRDCRSHFCPCVRPDLYDVVQRCAWYVGLDDDAPGSHEEPIAEPVEDDDDQLDIWAKA